MALFVGLDVAKRHTAVCVMNSAGVVIREDVVETTPQAIVARLRGQRARYARIGVESWTLAPWLQSALARAKLPLICIEAAHAHAVLKANLNKTDRTDARGIADLMRTGAFRPVHIKTAASQRILALLTTRRFLRAKLTDCQNAIQGLLLAMGLKLDIAPQTSFSARAWRLVGRDAHAGQAIQPLINLRDLIASQLAELDRALTQLAHSDSICQLLMSAPGIGPIVALTYRASIDEPRRFLRSRTIGAHLGLTPRTHQSGERERRGGITKHGDSDLRRMLYLAALSTFRRGAKSSWLKSWGEQIALRRGRKRAIVAIARRLAVVLHRMWITQTPFQWSRPPATG